MSVRAPWRIVGAAALALLSCGTNGSATPELVAVPATPATLRVEVGTGISEFVELADGDPVNLVYGSQGGYHVWTAIRVHDERVTDVQVNLMTRFEDGTPAGPATRTAVSLSPPHDGVRTAVGLRDFLENGAGLGGRRFFLRVEVVAGDQQHGEAEKLVTARGK